MTASTTASTAASMICVIECMVASVHVCVCARGYCNMSACHSTCLPANIVFCNICIDVAVSIE
jgi:hypothetical protein